MSLSFLKFLDANYKAKPILTSLIPLFYTANLTTYSSSYNYLLANYKQKPFYYTAYKITFLSYLRDILKNYITKGSFYNKFYIISYLDILYSVN